jgi:inhibitor of cysteine peptidase
LTLNLPAGSQPVILELESRPGTGYRWEVLPSTTNRYAQNANSEFEMRNAGPGATAVQRVELEPQGAGGGTIRLVYRRPFQPNEPIHARVTIQLNSVVGVIELTDPTPNQPITNGDAKSANHAPGAASSLPPRSAFPTAYDARALDIVPAVRDQGSCGSCWAFGTIGVMEVAVKLGGGPNNDLSEQFLISCNRDNWDCDGGLTASKYHFNALGDSQTAAGAVLESVKPYTASNGSCLSNYAKAYQASGWQFLTGSEWTMPTNDAIKHAIMTYGAVTAGVCVDNGWYYYRSGVYSSSSNVCRGYTNHQIVLVGWDDATQSWILRNSWGAGWGESGYMRIKYDPTGRTSRVGEGASWIRYGSSLHTLNVNSSGASAVVIGATPPTYGGITNYSKAGIASGTLITLSAPATASGQPFANWTGCTSTSDTNCTVSMSSSTSVTANYAPTPVHALTVNSVGASAVPIGATPSTYAGTTNYSQSGIVSGTAVTLTAPTAAGAGTFVNWTGCTSTSGVTCNLSMTANKTVTATYRTTSIYDLAVTNIAMSPTSPSANGTFNATVTVVNQGTTATNVGSLDVWANQGVARRCGARGTQYQPLGTIAAGSSKDFIFLGLPAGKVGAKTFRAFADSGCQISETSETNNQLAATYSVVRVGSGFNEQFNIGTATRWLRDFGAWSVRGGAYQTFGAPGLRATSTYNANYTDVDYTAMIRRYGSTTSANTLMVRAGGAVGRDGHLANYYAFQITADGSFSVWKRVGGSPTSLYDWTSSSAISQGSAWNALRVVAKGSALRFYINGVLVWQGTDTSLANGRVGVSMWNDGTAGNNVQVDWATLNPNPTAGPVGSPTRPTPRLTVPGTIDGTSR